jgi:hypothetical protein
VIKEGLSAYAEDHACVPKRLLAAGRRSGVQARALPPELHRFKVGIRQEVDLDHILLKKELRFV